MQEPVNSANAAPAFRHVRRQPLSVAGAPLVRESLPFDDLLPLVIEPTRRDVDLAGWARVHKAEIDAKFERHGAILFRGFSVEPVAVLEAVARIFSPDLSPDNGEHVPITAGSSIYTPVAYAHHRKLLWHNENSFNAHWPSQIWFACAKPADAGGETPLVDSRRVFTTIDPDVREPFVRKQVMYVRNYGTGLGLRWEDVFRTTDRHEVEARCRADGMTCRWKGGDILETRAVRPAVIPAKNGAISWFNQAQHWHVSCLDADTRASLQALFAEEDMPRNCYYGDGSCIEDAVMAHILDVYRRLEVVFPWQIRDVLMVDNISVAHARNPYDGERKQLVAIGRMTTFEEVLA